MDEVWLDASANLLECLPGTCPEPAVLWFADNPTFIYKNTNGTRRAPCQSDGALAVGDRPS